MIARLLATLCLLYVSAPAGRSESLAPAGRVDIYVKIDRSIPPAVLSSMKDELSATMQDTGVRLGFQMLNGAPPQTSSGLAVVAEFRGECGVSWHQDWTQASNAAAPLASSAVADGEVLPFSWVDCGLVSRLIGPLISDQPDALRDYVYGRALARVLAHELYHVLTQNSGHNQSGLAKGKFTAAELVSERFQFEGNAFRIIPAPASELAALPESRAGAAEVDEADFK